VRETRSKLESLERRSHCVCGLLKLKQMQCFPWVSIIACCIIVARLLWLMRGDKLPCYDEIWVRTGCIRKA
jgi:hypothetical protein